MPRESPSRFSYRTASGSERIKIQPMRQFTISGENEALVLNDADEGVEEALLRDAELDASAALGMSLEQFDEQFRLRRGRFTVHSDGH